MAPLDRSLTSFYSSFVVTMAVSCTVFEIKRDVVEKRQLSYPLEFNLHDPLELLRILAQIFNTNCRVHELLDGATILPKSSILSVGTNVTDSRQAHVIISVRLKIKNEIAVIQ